MRTAASCWNLLLLLWAFADPSPKEMCSCYEIQVPENYTALSGDLEVTIIGLHRKSSEEIQLELLEVEFVPSEGQDFRQKAATESEESNRIFRSASWTPDDETNGTNGTDATEYAEGASNCSGSSEIARRIKLKAMSRVLEDDRKQIPQIKVSKKWTILGSVAVPVPATELNDSDVAKVKFPCGVIARGGQFGVRLTGINEDINNLTRKHRSSKLNKFEASSIPVESGSNLSIVGLDVRWPPCSLSISPRHVETYPEVTVTAVLEFLPTECPPAVGAPLPETWLDLLSCGHSPAGCTDGNSTHRQVVYSEQIRGYPRRKSIVLGCELFGMAGHFALSLRPSVQTSTVIETQNKDAFLKTTWSEQYIFNVHARSIFPCDAHGGGVAVLFQYPQCILNGDRVRLFSRLRADVSSLFPPTSLHYVTEQRVTKGKHSLHFDCDLFSERFVEYCFAYVSRAITGAVFDVRMDCVPTFPITDSDVGGWGQWSSWTACTTTCGGGTRNRFRFCDSPSPRYGAKYCEGPPLETERCGNSDWDCEFYQMYPRVTGEGSVVELPADRPEIVAEVGPACRCGCVIHLGVAKPRRLLATSSQSCPGRTLWLVQADREHRIRFSVDHFRFPCASQWLKVRDGDAFTSTLIGELTGSHPSSESVTSTGPMLLVEFFSDELLAAGQECAGGFLAHAQQSPVNYSNTSAVSSGFSLSSILRNIEVAPTGTNNLTLVHGAVALFICIVIFVSGCLGIQYVHRYRKYHLAAAAEDMESVAGDSQCSLVAVRSRATSNSTLLSEVISLQRFKSSRRYKHSRLREEDHEMEEEQLSEDTDSQQETDNIGTPTPSQKTLKADVEVGSSTTASLPDTPKASPSSLRRSNTCISQKSPTQTSCYKVSKKSISTTLNPGYLSPMLDDIGNSSSLESNASRGSSEAVRKIFQLRRQSLSSSSTKSGSTITNGCDSPSSSLRSTVTRNPKERKDKRNLERLLAGSEFSLSGDADLELDYYDYNVHNASAVPESYIGMDPAYLIWVPPISPVSWDGEDDDSDSKDKLKEENIELDNQIRDSIIEDATPLGNNLEIQSKSLKSGKRENEETKSNKLNVVSKSNNRGTLYKVSKEQFHKTSKLVDELPERGRYVYINPEEKETRVEKSSSDQSVYYDLADEDIKFADDDDEELKTDNSKYEIVSGKNVKNDVKT